MATIQDVAKHAHVGVATVSRVLNGTGYVREETRVKVLSAIAELNYTPNEMAKNLFRSRTGIVAVIVPDTSHPFFAEFVNAAEHALSHRGYQTMVCNAWHEAASELHCLEMLKQKRVDGVIFGAHSLDTHLYQSTDRPIVALDRNLGPNIPCVAVDHRTGGQAAAEVLIQAGCKKVLQFGGDQSITSPSNLRHSEFERIMQEHGIPCFRVVPPWAADHYGLNLDTARETLDRFPDVDGVFGTDIIAMSTLLAARERGIRVPEDLKVVAYDGTGIVKLAQPSLTTIVQPITQLAQECVRLIVERIEGRETEHYVELKPVLHHGQSTGNP